MAYLKRALASYQQGLYDQTNRGFDPAIRLDPAFTDSSANHGLPSGEQSLYDRAISDCNKAIGLYPNDSNPHFIKAQRRLCRGTAGISAGEGFGGYY